MWSTFRYPVYGLNVENSGNNTEDWNTEEISDGSTLKEKSTSNCLKSLKGRSNSFFHDNRIKSCSFVKVSQGGFFWLSCTVDQ